MSLPKEILKKYWGFPSFRKPQEEIINDVINNKNVITLLPTGGGKSICFQVPALAKKGTCLVVSPLIALMQDQVKNLEKLGIKATFIPSNTNNKNIITLFDNIKFGNYKFLYISPERLQSKLVQQKIKEINLNLVAIDEAHCISEWGHDFRPSYRKITILKELHPTVNFIALTATANKKVLTDIAQNLELKNPKIFKKSFFKENLAYQIFKVDDKLLKLKQIFTKTKTPAIVYVNSRKKTEEIAQFLNANNFKSSFYHGGLSAFDKQTSYTNWMLEKTPIIVATNAFGMGIDKSNVGVVIHYDLPYSIENYIQEAGRAGRNGKKSFAVLLYNNNDLLLIKDYLNLTVPTIKEIKKTHKKLYQHYNIAYGDFFKEPFNFNILEFSKKYNFSTFKTDLVLKILSNNGIIEISNNYNKKSSLQIITNHNNFLNYLNNKPKLKNVVNIILRTYGGLFESKIKINEFFLAKKAGVSSKQIFTYLNQLQKDNLVNYSPITSEAELFFLLPREDDKTINKLTKNINQYISIKKQKTNHLINFVTNSKDCRSIQLLKYFDEKNSTECGICDICLANKNLSNNFLSNNIIQLLKSEKELTSQEISLKLKVNSTDILIHLRQLLSADLIRINSQNKYHISN